MGMNGFNPADPLRDRPSPERVLFDRFSVAANGFSTGDVIGAAANILVNAIRQTHATRDQAERSFDELFGRSKQILMDHYDSQGRKRGIFAFDQVVVMAPHFDKEKF